MTHNSFGRRGLRGVTSSKLHCKQGQPCLGRCGNLRGCRSHSLWSGRLEKSMAALRKAPTGPDLTSFTLLCAPPHQPVGIVTQQPPRCTSPTDRKFLVTDAKSRKSSGVCLPYFLFCPKLDALEFEYYMQPFTSCATFQVQVAHKVH